MNLIELSKPKDRIVFLRLFEGQETKEEQEWECPLNIEEVMSNLDLLNPYLETFDQVCEDTFEYNSRPEISDEYNLYDRLVDDRPNDPIADYQFVMGCNGYDVFIYHQGKSYILQR